MGFFSSAYDGAQNSEIQNVDAFNEACIISELAAMSEEDRNAVMNSDSYHLLEQKGLIGKKTRVRLSKSDDLARREVMAAIQLAREANDTLFDKLSLNRVKERELLKQIKTKYGARAKRAAVIGQRDYIKTIKNGGTITKKDLDNRS